MQSLIDKIESLKATLAALQPIAEKDQKRLAQKFRLEFNYNSNHMEGNTLTYGETELLLIFDDTRGNHNLREYEEMKAHDVSFQLVQQWAKDPAPLLETDIKNLHKTLLVRPFRKETVTPDGHKSHRWITVGGYKEVPNSVLLPNGEVFEYASVLDTPFQMRELMEWFAKESEKKELHPFQLAALYHYKFVRIHPFDDGNGRISRLLMNYILLKNDLPPVVIKSADKKNYLNALHDADVGNLDSFVRYIGNQLVWSLELAIKAAKGESIEEPDDIDKELSLLKRELTEKQVLTKKASEETTAEAFEQNVLPIFQLIETKLEVLKDLFFDVDRQMYVTYYDSAGKDQRIGYGESTWDTLMQNWFEQQVKQDWRRLLKIKYGYGFNGMKSSPKGEGVWVEFNVSFSEYNYQIGFESHGQRTFQFPYGEVIDLETRQKIVAPQVKDVIERIRQISKT